MHGSGLLPLIQSNGVDHILAMFLLVTYFSTICASRLILQFQENELKSTHCIADYGGDLAFQVRGMYGDQYVVDLKEKKCACNKWGLCGIPCKHAIACILQRGLNIFDFVHDSLRKSTQEKIYEHVIRPINGPELWERTGNNPVECPTFKKQRGRPKKMRRKEPDEYRTCSSSKTVKKTRKNILMTCTTCGKKDHHNKKTCNHHANQEFASLGILWSVCLFLQSSSYRVFLGIANLTIVFWHMKRIMQV